MKMENQASATSPPSLTPAHGGPQPLKIRPSPSASSPPAATSPLTPSSFTSKEWVVPPRPKPGRKPATDTPPTKRKAQNRAAQRAFRERRAARVGELEEQIQQIEDQENREIEMLKSTIGGLERDLQGYMKKCRVLEKRVESEREKKEKLALELMRTSGTGQTEAVPLPRRRSWNKPKSQDFKDAQDELTESNIPLGCGNCSLDSRCQCIEEVINGADAISAVPQSHASKPSSQFYMDSAEGQIKTEPQDQNELETDFTTYQAQRPQAISDEDVIMTSPETSTPVSDPCGFCTDGTPCVCAQMAAQDENFVAQRAGLPSSESTSSPTVASNIPSTSTSQLRLRQQTSQQITPPPSETDVTNPCINGPGTCAQCLADPGSTLFCKSLAASRAQSSVSAANGVCCGSRANCTRTEHGNDHKPAISSPLRLSCADTYTTLSRHQGFQKASQEIDSWMPKLAAESSATEGRHPMDIEAASIMGLLSEFDRRFPAGKGDERGQP